MGETTDYQIMPVSDWVKKSERLSKIVADPVKLQNDLVVDTERYSGFVLLMGGKLVPTNKGLAEIIKGYAKK